MRINTNVQAIEQAQGRAQVAVQATVDAAATVGGAALEELILLTLVARACTQRQAARAVAKWGEASHQVIALEAKGQQLEHSAILAQANLERFQAAPVAAAADRYVYQGRVADDQGLGVAGRVVTAKSEDGTTLVSTTTDAAGNFTLTLDVADAPPTAAEAAAAADPTAAATGKVTRDAVATGKAAFTVEVATAAGGTTPVTDAALTVRPGVADATELVVSDAPQTLELDPKARFNFTTANSG